jgi:hypothetical protein
MKKVFALFAIVTMILAVNATAFVGSENSQDLQVQHVTVTPATEWVDNLKKDGPDPNFAAYDFAMDGYTALTIHGTAPSVFSLEEYTFSGGSLTTVDHRVIYNNNATPNPTIALAYVWVNCGQTTILPPTGGIVGLCPAGISLSLPSGGIWYITVGISGFTAGSNFDWLWVAQEGVTCVTAVGALNTLHTHGGSIAGGPPGEMYDNNRDSDRPWCFTVNP